MSSDDPDRERVQRRAKERQHERAAIAEDVYARVDRVLDGQKFPVTSEELAVTYADTMLDLPNETESLGDVFDRLVDERYASATEAREAVVNELTGEAGGPEEYNDERPLSSLDEDEEPGPR